MENEVENGDFFSCHPAAEKIVFMHQLATFQLSS